MSQRIHSLLAPHQSQSGPPPPTIRPCGSDFAPGRPDCGRSDTTPASARLKQEPPVHNHRRLLPPSSPGSLAQGTSLPDDSIHPHSFNDRSLPAPHSFTTHSHSFAPLKEPPPCRVSAPSCLSAVTADRRGVLYKNGIPPTPPSCSFHSLPTTHSSSLHLLARSHTLIAPTVITQSSKDP